MESVDLLLCIIHKDKSLCLSLVKTPRVLLSINLFKTSSLSFPLAHPLFIILLRERMCPFSGGEQSRDLLNDNLSPSSHFSTRLIYLIKYDACTFVALIGA